MNLEDFKTFVHNSTDEELLQIRLIAKEEARQRETSPDDDVQVPMMPLANVSKSVYDFRIGDTVVFNAQVRPEYLIGKKAKVVKLNRSRIKVTLFEPVGRFSTRPVGCPLSIIDKA